MLPLRPLLVAASFLAACSSSQAGLDASVGAGPDAAQQPTDGAQPLGADAATLVDAGAPPDAAALRFDAADPKRFDEIEASFLAEMAAFKAPGVAVAIVERGELTFAKGFGVADPGKPNVPMAPTTLFRLASLTKQLTAAGLLQLVAAGKVDLDQPITTYIPNFGLEPDTAKKVLVRHLLNHTAGFVDYLEIDAPPAERGDRALQDFFTTGRFANVGYFQSPPGRFYNYSNPNFMVAGLVIERASLTNYRTYMATKLFKPLGMNRTFFLPSEVTADGDFAVGVSEANGKEFMNGPAAYDNGWGRPCGYAFSSVVDLAKWTRFLMEGNDAVLPRAQREAMQAEQAPMDAYLDLLGYGFGLIVQKGFPLPNGKLAPGERLVWHNGALDGFATQVNTAPDHNFAVVVLANRSGAYFDKSIALAFDRLTPHRPATGWPDPQIDPATFGRFVAEYVDPFRLGRMIVTLDGTELKISMPDLDAGKIPYSPVLVPTSDRNFTLTVQGFPWDATFFLDAQGKPEFLRTRAFVGQVGATTKAFRKPSTREEILAHLARVQALVEPGR